MEHTFIPSTEYWHQLRASEQILFARNKTIGPQMYPQIIANEVWGAEFRDEYGADLIAYNALKSIPSIGRKVMLTKFAGDDTGGDIAFAHTYRLSLKEGKESLSVVPVATRLTKWGMTSQELWKQGYKYKIPKGVFRNILHLITPTEEDYRLVADEFKRGEVGVYSLFRESAD